MNIIDMNDRDAVEQKIDELQDSLEHKRETMSRFSEMSRVLNRAVDTKEKRKVEILSRMVNRGMNILDLEMQKESRDLRWIFSNMDARAPLIFP